MIILDTNILSAVMHEVPDPIIVEWLDVQARESIWTTAITVFEIRLGLSILEKGKRRERLEQSELTVAYLQWRSVLTERLERFCILEKTLIISTTKRGYIRDRLDRKSLNQQLRSVIGFYRI